MQEEIASILAGKPFSTSNRGSSESSSCMQSLQMLLKSRAISFTPYVGIQHSILCYYNQTIGHMQNNHAAKYVHQHSLSIQESSLNGTPRSPDFFNSGILFRSFITNLLPTLYLRPKHEFDHSSPTSAKSTKTRSCTSSRP
jgi:hypothetical protein